MINMFETDYSKKSLPEKQSLQSAPSFQYSGPVPQYPHFEQKCSQYPYVLGPRGFPPPPPSLALQVLHFSGHAI